MKLGTVKKCNIKFLDLPVFPVINLNTYLSGSHELYFSQKKVKYIYPCFKTWMKVKHNETDLLIEIIDKSKKCFYYIKDSDYDKIIRIERRKFIEMCKNIKKNFNDIIDYEPYTYYLLTNKKSNEEECESLINKFINGFDNDVKLIDIQSDKLVLVVK